MAEIVVFWYTDVSLSRVGVGLDTYEFAHISPRVRHAQDPAPVGLSSRGNLRIVDPPREVWQIRGSHLRLASARRRS